MSSTEVISYLPYGLFQRVEVHEVAAHPQVAQSDFDIARTFGLLAAMLLMPVYLAISVMGVAMAIVA